MRPGMRRPRRPRVRLGGRLSPNRRRLKRRSRNPSPLHPSRRHPSHLSHSRPESRMLGMMRFGDGRPIGRLADY
jgi:hypothetical protein